VDKLKSLETNDRKEIAEDAGLVRSFLVDIADVMMHLMLQEGELPEEQRNSLIILVESWTGTPAATAGEIESPSATAAAEVAADKAEVAAVSTCSLDEEVAAGVEKEVGEPVVAEEEVVAQEEPPAEEEEEGAGHEPAHEGDDVSSMAPVVADDTSLGHHHMTPVNSEASDIDAMATTTTTTTATTAEPTSSAGLVGVISGAVGTVTSVVSTLLPIAGKSKEEGGANTAAEEAGMPAVTEKEEVEQAVEAVVGQVEEAEERVVREMEEVVEEVKGLVKENKAIVEEVVKDVVEKVGDEPKEADVVEEAIKAIEEDFIVEEMLKKKKPYSQAKVGAAVLAGISGAVVVGAVVVRYMARKKL